MAWHITPCNFLLKHYIPWTKKSHKVQILRFLIALVKFTKYPMSFMKPQAIFPSKSASIFSIMTQSSSIHSQLKYYILMSKEAHQRAKFQTFDCSHEISPNLYFDRLLLLKVCKIPANKVMRSYVSWHWRVTQNLKKNWYVRSTRNSHNLYFNWFLLRKVYNVWPKTV